MGTLRIGGHEYHCDLAAGDRAGACSWCGAPLPPRRVRWCSDTCAHAYADQHVWTAARRAALDRDGYRCTRCEARPPRLEVHHRYELDPARHGYEPGCEHHLEPALAHGFLLRVQTQVSNQGSGSSDVIAQHSERRVAVRAEDAPRAAGGVGMVYVRDDFSEAAFADGTRVPLLLEHLPIDRGGQLVVEPKIAGPHGAFLGAVDRVSAGHSAGTTEEAGHWLLRDFAAVPGLAALIAVERRRSPIEQRCSALEATIGDRTAIKGAVAAEPRVMAFAQLGCLLRSHAGATSDNAGLIRWQSAHSDILSGVHASDMPPLKGGLETLCEPCHRAEHTFRHEVERLVVWADGRLSYQMALPGIAA